MRHSPRGLLLGLLAFGVPGKSEHGSSGTGDPTTTDSSISISQATSSSSSSPLATPTWGNGTCWSRTANYITHTLPQQCLRTDRTSTNATKDSATHETSHAQVDSATGTPSTTQTTSESVASGTSTSIIDSVSSSQATEETDSPLDNANFLSFEEWKRQNEAKAGYAAEQAYTGDRQRPGINNALDTLGDEGEIELDFSGFGTGANGPRQQQAAYRTAEGSPSASSAPTAHTPRSKDAGKTCKERTNYASFDCAATVLKNNPECKSASSILVENKDSYMLNTCSASNKFFIVELCNDILIDTVVLANYEFFSSIFRHFRISVSDRYPVKMDKWRDLGTFEARNTREVQAFLIEHPQIWARYLRIEFLSHYGSEYYCPLSLLRVHGTTMLEEIRPQDEIAHEEGADADAVLEAEATAIPPISQEPMQATDEAEKATLQAIPTAEDTSSRTSPVASSVVAASSHASVSTTEVSASEIRHADPPDLTWTINVDGIPTSVAILIPTDTSCPSPVPFSIPQTSPPRASSSHSAAAAKRSSDSESSVTGSPAEGNDTKGNNTSIEHSSVERATALITLDSTMENSTQAKTMNATRTATLARAGSITSNTSTTEVPNKETGSTNVTSSSAEATRSTTGTQSTSSTIAQPPQPQPSTQESFFKSIHKRLQQLEANSTLSLQYIEEQSRILRDAFAKVEKRQISATTSFLSTLNETVMTELHGFRQAYDQIWQSTVIELEGQREQWQREMLALSTRLTIVGEELVWQKRMGIVQSMLLLLCLGLVLFARTGQAGYFEVPLLQQMRNKSYTALNMRAQRGWESPVDSPSPQSRSPVRLLRRKLMWRSYTEPSVGTDSRPESQDGPPLEMGMDVDVKIEPPTPESEVVGVPTPETEDEDDEGESEDMVDTREVWSSPPTPTGMRERERQEEPPDLMGVSVDNT